MTEQTPHDMATAIMEKSLRDGTFRAALVADPKGTLEREIAALTGQAVKLPENVTVSVDEATPEHIRLVIPAKGTEGESSDNALAQIAGGSRGSGTAAMTAGTTTGLAGEAAAVIAKLIAEMAGGGTG